jgi:hypothetical protein
MTKCDCPFCPLVEAKVYLCDVMIMVDAEGSCSFGRIETVPVETRIHFITIMSLCKNNYKQKVGTSLDLSQPGFTCIVERINSGLFKICFQTDHPLMQ